MASFGGSLLVGLRGWIGGAALECARTIDFQAAATFTTLANSILSALFPHQPPLAASIFLDTPPPTTPQPTDKYIRRGYLQTPKSTHTNLYSHINIDQTNNQITTTTTTTHLQNPTSLQYISTPTVPLHITKNGRP
jgi:hypothetical protein